MKPLLLIVEDDEILCSTYCAYLSQLDVDFETAASLKEAAQHIERRCPDILLLDLLLPDGHGFDLIDVVASKPYPCSVLVVTTENNVESTRRALLSGAEDYLLKPLSPERIYTTIQNTLEKVVLKNKVDRLESSLPASPAPGMIGESMAMRAVYGMIEAAARYEASVFIGGESGTGKELCASAIHKLSPRADESFVALNCAAIPSELLESEIFGHRQGAFSGASKAREGAAGRANGGTLFLDEICELDIKLQAKLLRLLQSGEYRPVGSDKEKVMDARVLCASNKNPLEEVKAGRMREDLYYRLCVINIVMPPLRDRGRDIMILAQHLLKESNARRMGIDPIPRFTEEALVLLCQYPWPGNVRQLDNVVQNVLMLNRELDIPGIHIRQVLSGLDPNIDDHFGSGTTLANEDSSFLDKGDILPFWVEEKRIIERAIEICNDNIPLAAKRLDVSCSTIYRKLKRWQSG